VPARPSATDLDDLVDYLLVAVPAQRCAEVVRSTAGRVPFVHVISGGFAEAGADGARLGDELAAAGREVGARIVGPNCIGVYCPAGRQTFQLGAPRAEGAVAIVSQSGGLAGDIVKAGDRRGLRFSKVATVGNAVDVTPGELLDWLVDDPETEAAGVYLEGSADAEQLTAVLRRAAGRMPVALLLGGQSQAGAAAVASHTGSLAGDRRIWQAVADATGTALVTTLEELLAVLTYAQRWRSTPTAGTDVLVLGVGGGASVLAADACGRAGLDVAPTAPAVRHALRDMGYGVGTSVANPVEIPFGPVTPADTLRAVLDPMLAAQPYPDVVVHVNVQAYYSYGEAGIVPLAGQLEALASGVWPHTRLAVVARNLECAPGPDAERLRQAMVELDLPLFPHFDEAAAAIAAAQRFAAAAGTTPNLPPKLGS
jgi:acyl-CoA synthetase (NDP forming)